MLPLQHLHGNGAVLQLPVRSAAKAAACLHMLAALRVNADAAALWVGQGTGRREGASTGGLVGCHSTGNLDLCLPSMQRMLGCLHGCCNAGMVAVLGSVGAAAVVSQLQRTVATAVGHGGRPQDWVAAAPKEKGSAEWRAHWRLASQHCTWLHDVAVVSAKLALRGVLRRPEHFAMGVEAAAAVEDTHAAVHSGAIPRGRGEFSDALWGCSWPEPSDRALVASVQAAALAQAWEENGAGMPLGTAWASGTGVADTAEAMGERAGGSRDAMGAGDLGVGDAGFGEGEAAFLAALQGGVVAGQGAVAEVENARWARTVLCAVRTHLRLQQEALVAPAAGAHGAHQMRQRPW